MQIEGSACQPRDSFLSPLTDTEVTQLVELSSEFIFIKAGAVKALTSHAPPSVFKSHKYKKFLWKFTTFIILGHECCHKDTQTTFLLEN